MLSLQSNSRTALLDPEIQSARSFLSRPTINSPQPLLTFRVSVKKSAVFLPKVTFRSELAFLTAFHNLPLLFAVTFLNYDIATLLRIIDALYPHLSLDVGNVLLYFTEYIFHSFNIYFNASSTTPKLCLFITPQRSCLLIFFLTYCLNALIYQACL